MADHKTLPNDQLHEPIDVVNASSGEVYVADGSGSGNWTNNFAYGQLKVDNDSTDNEISLSEATDSSLNANSDYVKLLVSGLWQEDGSYRTTLSASGGEITLDHAGTYEINFYCSLYTNTSDETDIAFKWDIGGQLSTTKLIDTFKGSGQRHSVSATGIYDSIGGNSVVSLYVASDTAQTITISDAVFFVRMVKAD